MRTLVVALVVLAAPVSASERVRRLDLNLHLVAGLGVGAVSHALVSGYGRRAWPDMPHWTPLAAAVAGSAVAGAAKEAADALGLGTPEWVDLGATLLGGLAGGMLAELLMRIPFAGVSR